MAPENRRRSTRTKSRLSYVEEYPEMDEEYNSKATGADEDQSSDDDDFRPSQGHGADDDEPTAEEVAHDAFESDTVPTQHPPLT